MSRFARILALLLVAAAIVLAVLAFSVSRHKAAPATAPVAVAPVTPASGHPVVVAASPLNAGESIDASKLRIDNLPTAPEGGFDRIDAVAGRMPRQAIAAGTVLTADSLAQGIALQLRPGERALAIPVDEVAGVGNRIAPGDFVDVFFALKRDQDRNGSTQARLLLSRLHVLAYGNSTLGAVKTAKPDGGQPARTEAASPRTAVLAVPVDAVDRLLLASKEGKLSLALRHPDDRSVADAALFAAPPSVLPQRTGLTPDQQATITHPENQAYAGIDVEGLDARGAPPPRAPRVSRERPASGGVEVIRGAQRGKLFATPSCIDSKECAP